MRINNMLRFFIVLFLVMLAKPSSAIILKIATLSPEGSYWMSRRLGRHGSLHLSLRWQDTQEDYQTRRGTHGHHLRLCLVGR